MKMKFLYAAMFVVAITLLTASTALAENCAGQVVLDNQTVSATLELIAWNNPKQHLDVPPQPPYVFKGHVDYNQPALLTKYTAETGDVPLLWIWVAPGCNFGGDLVITVTDTGVTYNKVQGFWVFPAWMPPF